MTSAPCDAVLLFLQSAPESTTYAAFERHCRIVHSLPNATCKPAQRLFMELFFPPQSIFAHFPPRTSYLRSFVKKYFKAIEDAESDRSAREDPEGAWEENDPYEDLQVCYAHLCAYREEVEEEEEDPRCSVVDWRREYCDAPSVLRFQKRARCLGWEFKDYPPCFRVFLHRRDDNGKGKHSTYSRASWQKSLLATQMGVSDVCTASPSDAAFFLIRVATNQFANVGLSLWPSAFLLAQILTQALSEGDGSDLSTAAASRLMRLNLNGKRQQRRLRMLELGAGVGLTAVALHPLERFHQTFDQVFLSDYMQSALDNIRFNLLLNGLSSSDDAGTSESVISVVPNGERDSSSVYRTVPMDWAAHEENAALLSEWKCDVILAADCVYDVSCVPALAKTIHQALQHAPADGPATCILVQNHRQEQTVRAFFDAISPFTVTDSYQVMSVPKKRVDECNAAMVFDSVVHNDDDNENGGEEDGEGSCQKCVVLVPVTVDESGSAKPVKPCAAAVPICVSWIGPYWLELTESACVHIITLADADAA